jgi:hypothetical protein
MRNPIRGRIVITHHLAFMGYGHWLPNDIRGSGSENVRKDLLQELGEIHSGRKRVQPKRDELREFHRDAEGRLDQSVLWFDAAHRSAIARSFGLTAQNMGYTIWACAVLRNHAHLVVKRHAHRHDVMWRTFAEGAAESLRVIAELSPQHRVWGERPFSRMHFTPQEVKSRIQYVQQNPEKERLARQNWEFVQPYPY